MKTDWLLWGATGLLLVVTGIQLYNFYDIQFSLACQEKIRVAVMENRALLENITEQLARCSANTTCTMEETIEDLEFNITSIDLTEVEKRCAK